MSRDCPVRKQDMIGECRASSVRGLKVLIGLGSFRIMCVLDTGRRFCGLIDEMESEAGEACCRPNSSTPSSRGADGLFDL